MASLGLTGKETSDINLPQNPQVGQLVDVVARKGAEEIAFKLGCAEADLVTTKTENFWPMAQKEIRGGVSMSQTDEKDTIACDTRISQIVDDSLSYAGHNISELVEQSL